MWKVLRNPVGGKYVYQVYRIIDERQPMHSGNIETNGIIYDTEEEAQEAADELNKAEGDSLMWQKRMVYVVTVFFTESCDFDRPSEEYFAATSDDIEQVKARIYEDYSEEEIAEIVVSDRMVQREFWISCSR